LKRHAITASIGRSLSFLMCAGRHIRNYLVWHVVNTLVMIALSSQDLTR
jgi:hypothetical protein